MHLGVPRSGVGSAGFSGELLLGEAHASFIAVVGAHSAFTGNAVVVGKALAFTSLAVANALSRAFNGRMGIVGTGDVANPCRSPEK